MAAMAAVIFVGIQAAGKTTFYRQRFFDTHVRISLDMLRTRHRERALIETCLAIQQPFVVDNTNPTIAERARYLAAAATAGVPAIGYYFPVDLGEAIRRNAARRGKANIPVRGIAGTLKRLEPPTLAEGFAALFVVRPDEAGSFLVEEWHEGA